MTLESYPVRSQFRSDSASQLVSRPVESLLAVSADAKTLLNDLGITSIFDLGASILFDTARRIVEAADVSGTSQPQFIGADFIDATERGKSAAELSDSSIAVLRQVGEAIATQLEETLGISTVREMAAWPAYRTARAIINDAFGLTPTIVDDDERPDDLIPIARRYATERVQYDVIVLQKTLADPRPMMSGSWKDTKLGGAAQVKSTEIAAAGGIDVSDLVKASGNAKAAVGAVLTYRQSWFPQGLALGHLLHSLALAPGESTRVAMIDWNRSVRAMATEDTTQSEAMTASIDRTRAMSEVTRAVANEAQTGFSGSSSTAYQAEAGVSAGIGGILPVGGLNVGSAGASSSGSYAHTGASGWASSAGHRDLNAEMRQNITDQTHQAANSVRNRRATAVTETSQKESETLTTRVVTNYNHMHALTIQYFEVVQVYRVLVELARVTRCLFVPMRIIKFSSDVLTRYRDVIAAAGLTPEIRGLSGRKQTSLILRAPIRLGTWDPSLLALAAQAIGERIGQPGDPDVYLPIEGLKIKAIYSHEKVQDAFQGVDIYSRQGDVYSVDFTENMDPQGGTIAPLDAPFGPRDYAQILLRRKDGHEDFKGTYTFGLSFDIDFSAGLTASQRVNTNALIAKIKIKIPETETDLPIFTFEQSLADTDVIDHLDQNALHYSTAIWRALDAATITTLLSTYELDKQALIEVIDPVPVTVSGNYIVFRLYAADDSADWQAFLDRLDTSKPPQQDLIPLPSGGVFAEAVLGRSNSGEKLDITRFWNWQDSPIPILPPEINPLNAGGKADDTTPKTGALESPIVNIMNAPPLPDPAGLAPLYSAIANGSMFRDMSGFAQVAALAGSAMNAAQAGAAQAGTAAGSAQQVAAKMFSDVLQAALQAAMAAGGIPSIGGVTRGGAQALPQTPTNLGAVLPIAEKLDRAEAAASSPEEWAKYPGSSKEPPLSSPPLLDAPASPTGHVSALLHGTLPGAPATEAIAAPKTVPQLLPMPNVPLDPGNGGRSIGLGALEPADIILSTTDQWGSWFIKKGTQSPVSHSMLYVGGGQVVEAIEEGVVLRPLTQALADASFAVALRYQALPEMKALEIVDFAGTQIGAKYDYGYGTFRQALFRLDLITMCHGLQGEALHECRRWLGMIDIGTATNDEWFCSELITKSFEQAGFPLTDEPAAWVAPDDIIQLSSNGMLGYVGHLKTAK